MGVLSILLTILKVLGIILIVILAVIITLLSIILFIPIQYEASFDYEKELHAKVKVSWFLRLFSIKYSIDNGDTDLAIRAIKRLGHSNKSDDKHKKKTTTKEDERETAKKTKVIPDDIQEQDIPSEEKSSKDLASHEEPSKQVKTKEQKVKKEIKQTIDKREVIKDPTIKDNAKKEKPTKKELNSDTRHKNNKKKKRKKRNNNKEFSDSNKDKLKESMYSKVKKILSHKDRKTVVRKVIRALKKIYRHIRPKKMAISLVIGLEDPANTGYVIGTISAIKPFLDSNNKISVTGDFEKEIIKGKGYVKGRIYLFYLSQILLKLLLDKQVRHYVSFIQKTINI